MNSIKDYDEFLLKLDQEISNRPDEKYRIILQAIQNTDCPFLKRRIKAHFREVDNRQD